MSPLHKLRRWYQGTPIVADLPNHRTGSVVFIGTPFVAGVRYHWSAKLVRAIVAFYLQYWKWIWSIVTSVVAAWLFG